MRILIISDIHSNYHALQAVLATGKYDKTYCLGDIVSYGSQPRECLETVLATCDGIVVGNHDLIIAKCSHDTEPGITECSRWNHWTAGQINDSGRASLLILSRTINLRDKQTTITLTHTLDGANYVTQDNLEECLASSDFTQYGTLTCFGHSHIPFIRKIKGRVFVNAGSVGQPRDHDPRAAFVVIEDGVPSIHRVAYDLEAAASLLGTLPLHPEYIALWQEFMRQGLVEKEKVARFNSAVTVN